MKKIEAFIRHESFEPIRMELLELGFPSLSISEVKGSGRQKGITERYRGAELTNWLRPKVKIECVVANADVQIIAANPSAIVFRMEMLSHQPTSTKLPASIVVPLATFDQAWNAAT